MFSFNNKKTTYCLLLRQKNYKKENAIDVGV